MKILKNHISVLLVLTLAISSCKRDFLDTQPLGSFASSATWGDGPLSEAYVTGIYSGLGNGGFDEQMLASLSDEAVFTHAGRGINTINEGILNESNLGWVNGTYEWTSMYNTIRLANVALENLPTATFDNQLLKDRLTGEALFLRAFYYHQLIRFYGGVPLVLKSYALNEDYSIDRSSYDDCVKAILKDCDDAIVKLDGKSLPKGRASKLAALALKSRTLLYAASDLHDIPTAKAKSALIAAYPKPELLGYLTGDRTARWQAAKDAAKAVLDATSGYKLDYAAPASLEEAKKKLYVYINGWWQ